MNIQFVGFVAALETASSGTLVTVTCEMAAALGKNIQFIVPQDQAAHWLPGRTVQFTAYTLPQQERPERFK